MVRIWLFHFILEFIVNKSHNTLKNRSEWEVGGWEERVRGVGSGWEGVGGGWWEGKGER
jgi:hypothetical protein